MQFEQFSESPKIEIPKIFQSFDGVPFEKCMVCTTPLLDAETPYLIERAFVHTEPIYEFALCLTCTAALSHDVSEESMTRLQEHLRSKLQPERMMRLLIESPDDVNPWIDECMLSSKSRADCRSYSICGVAEGNQLRLLGMAPYMISDDGIASMRSLLSTKSQEAMDDFTGTFLGTPPEFEDMPSPLLLM